MDKTFGEIAGPLQMRALEHLWKNGAQTVHQVVDALNAQPGARPLAYTTLLTVLRNLVHRKLCTVESAARAHQFTPAMSRDDYRAGVARWAIAVQFAGDAKAAAATFAAAAK